MGKYEILATGALMMNISSFFTLIQKVHYTKNTTSFPWYYLFGNMIAQILLITYGVINGAYGLYLPTILLLIGLLYIAYVKLLYNDTKIVVKRKEDEN
jgi:uncharacterized membrane protein YdcZ (DUF606 family)